MGWKQSLKKILTKAQFDALPSGFDAVGDIAILEIPKELKKKSKKIAAVFQKEHKNFKVIAAKSGGHEGAYRIRKVRVLAGEKRTQTEHKESGLRMLVDVDKVYFSPRLSTERLRIAKLVKPKEKVLVLFSGVAPYALVIAKHSKASSISSVELNPAAHKLAVKNILLNKLSSVVAVKAEARRWLSRSKNKFDRIIMPLPWSAAKFLPTVLKAAKKNAKIHFYTFAPEEDLKSAADAVKKICKAEGKKCRIKSIVKVGQQRPRVYRVCVDFSVN